MGLGRLHQSALFLSHRGGPDVLGRPRDQRHVLVAQIAAGEGRLGLGQLLQLTSDFHALGGRTTRELALPLEPGDEGHRAIRRELAGLVEAPHPSGEGGLQRVDAAFADLDQAFT